MCMMWRSSKTGFGRQSRGGIVIPRPSSGEASGMRAATAPMHVVIGRADQEPPPSISSHAVFVRCAITDGAAMPSHMASDPLGATAGIAGALSGGIVLSEGAINPAHAASSATISVSGTQWGVSTAYIGATEGNVRFNTADMSDLGINTYRIYGGMSRWEWQDPYSPYGTPTIDQIKANPSVINW